MGDEIRGSDYQLNLLGSKQLGLLEEVEAHGPVYKPFSENDGRLDYRQEDEHPDYQKRQLGLYDESGLCR